MLFSCSCQICGVWCTDILSCWVWIDVLHGFRCEQAHNLLNDKPVPSFSISGLGRLMWPLIYCLDEVSNIISELFSRLYQLVLCFCRNVQIYLNTLSQRWILLYLEKVVWTWKLHDVWLTFFPHTKSIIAKRNVFDTRNFSAYRTYRMPKIGDKV